MASGCGGHSTAFSNGTEWKVFLTIPVMPQGNLSRAPLFIISYGCTEKLKNPVE